MKNALTDLLDRFADANCADARWKTALRVCEDQGLGHLLISQVEEASNDILWINTNMPSAWMSEYLEQDYAAVDPVIRRLAGQVGHMRLETGQLAKEDASDARSYDLNHGLKSHGMGFLHCSRFGQRGNVGTYVTLCSSQTQTETEGGTVLELDVLAAVLATLIVKPVDNEANRKLGHAWLSGRQKEVLQLLAEGCQTGQIADRLGVSEVTVRKHFFEARSRLGASTRAQALAIAMQRGFVSL